MAFTAYDRVELPNRHCRSVGNLSPCRRQCMHQSKLMHAIGQLVHHICIDRQLVVQLQLMGVFIYGWSVLRSLKQWSSNTKAKSILAVTHDDWRAALTYSTKHLQTCASCADLQHDCCAATHWAKQWKHINIWQGCNSRGCCCIWPLCKDQILPCRISPHCLLPTVNHVLFLCTVAVSHESIADWALMLKDARVQESNPMKLMLRCHSSIR